MLNLADIAQLREDESAAATSSKKGKALRQDVPVHQRAKVRSNF